MAVTTPEEAAAFLAAMRDKSRGGVRVQPPSNLSADGYDAWFSQQKEREKEMKRKRQEAEALLHGYRSSLSHQKLVVTGDEKDREKVWPQTLIENGELTGMDLIEEDEWVDSDGETGAAAIGRLNLSAYFGSPDLNETKVNDTEIGKLNLPKNSDGVAAEAALQRANGGGRAVVFDDVKSFGTITTTPSRDADEENVDMESNVPQRKKEKPVPTPLRHLIPDETAWRDFVCLGRNQFSTVMHRLCVVLFYERESLMPFLFSNHILRGRREISIGEWSVPSLCLLR